MIKPVHVVLEEGEGEWGMGRWGWRVSGIERGVEREGGKEGRQRGKEGREGRKEVREKER